MTSTTRGEGKVVRIGVVQGDRLVLERSFAHHEAITIGSHPSARIRIPIGAASDPWPLITPNGDVATLRVPANARAKIATGSDVRSIAGGAEVSFGNSDRGKVRIGDVTILFQVTSAARVATNGPRLDFRGRLLDEEDGLVLGFASVIGTAATVAVIAARLLLPAEDPEIAPPYERINWSDLKHVAAVRAPAKPSPVAPATPAPARPPKEGVVAAAPAKPGPAPGRAEPAPLVNAAILVLGTHGRDAPPAPGIAAVMADIPGGYEVVNPDKRAHSGAPLGGPIDIGGTADPMLRVPGTPTTLEPAPDLPFICEYPAPEALDPTTDGEAIKRTIQLHAGDLKYCYEKSAKVRSGLSGRVEVTWEVHGGRAIGVTVDENYTGDAALGSCIATQLGRWPFTGVADTEVTWPFVFKARE